MFSAASKPPSASSFRGHTRKKVLHLSSSTDLLIEEDYGEEAALVLTQMLLKLSKCGYPRAELKSTTVFDRIMGGLCWLLQRIVRREHAEYGRVQWDLLFQSHHKMKPRLGLAQEIVRRIERLVVDCPVPIQPHQLLLQDFSDIGALSRVLDWLLEQDEASEHLAKLRSKRKYLRDQEATQVLHEALTLQQQFGPKRRRQLVADSTRYDQEEPEDVAIQRCLLEYGERVNLAVLTGDHDLDEDDNEEEEQQEADIRVDAVRSESEPIATRSGAAQHKELMASLASQAQAKNRTRGSPKPLVGLNTPVKESDPAFAVEYQQAERQALREEQRRLRQQKQREAELLQQMQAIPELQSFAPNASQAVLGQVDNVANAVLPMVSSTTTTVDQSPATTTTNTHRFLKHHSKMQTQLSSLEAKATEVQEALDACQALKSQRLAEETQIADAMARLHEQMTSLEFLEANQSSELKPVLTQLRQLVARNDELKKQEQAFKTNCRQQAQELETRLNGLRLQDGSNGSMPEQDEETFRLLEIEQLYDQMAGKTKDMKQLLAHQTHAVNKQLRRIDEIPSRVELIQYEKRFVELYEEMALTLDETRKYFCVYNTLKQTHQFLEKEISLINSIVTNFSNALSTKASSEAFFKQIHGIISQVADSVAKQKHVRQEKQLQVDTLDSKYQLLLEKERVYVKAIGEFQRECERNEKLAAQQQQQQRHETQTEAEAEAA